MSCNYADGLSPYHDKGQLGLEEKFDNKSAISSKVCTLAKWINKSKHVVLHTGAGISTSAGIPDFRGPKGVWTLQAKGQKPDISTDFNEAIPTPTHMAITRLVEQGKAKYVVSQNIDGLHLRSGLPRKNLSELHGNMFIEQCNICNRQFVRKTACPSVGQKNLNKACPTIKPNGRACRGRLHDTILDWEHNLPENDLAMADFHSCMADLSIAIGTTMQIVPSGSLPLYTKKTGGKLVIINLQPTKHNSKADLLIHGYADDVMAMLMKQLSLRIPKYNGKNDPTRLTLSSDFYFEWTISDAATAAMRLEYEAKCGTKEAKKRLEVIDDDDLPLISRVKELTPKEHKTRKRKSEEPLVTKPAATKSKSRKVSDDSDVEVVEEIPKRRGRPPKNRESLLITSTKLVIKKNVTPTKTKYEIVPSKSEKKAKKGVKIVYDQDTNACEELDLEMVCESDDETPIPFTTNFRRYLYDDKTFKREDEKKPEDVDISVKNSSTDAVDSGKPADTENKDDVPKVEESDDKKEVNATDLPSTDENAVKEESKAEDTIANQTEPVETSANDGNISEIREISDQPVSSIPVEEEEKVNVVENDNTSVLSKDAEEKTLALINDEPKDNTLQPDGAVPLSTSDFEVANSEKVVTPDTAPTVPMEVHQNNNLETTEVAPESILDSLGKMNSDAGIVDANISEVDSVAAAVEKPKETLFPETMETEKTETEADVVSPTFDVLNDKAKDDDSLTLLQREEETSMELEPCESLSKDGTSVVEEAVAAESNLWGL